MGRGATVDCVHLFFGLHRQAVGGSLRHCGDITSDEICTVDIIGMSFSLEEYFVKSVCFVPCKLFLLLIPHSEDLWSYGGTLGDLQFLPTCLDYVQRWNCASEFSPLPNSDLAKNLKISSRA